MLRGRRYAVILTMCVFALPAAAQEQGAGDADFTLHVDADFPSGAADVVAIDQEQRRVQIRPPAPENRGWVVWWYFRLSGIRPGETITLEVGNPPWSTPAQAAFSLDNHAWTQTSPGEKIDEAIVYRQRVDGPEAWFAWGPPFTPNDARRLVDYAGKDLPCAAAFELCRTREGRSTPAVVIDEPGGEEAKFGVWIQARQHAWESGSSWVCQGAVEWLTSDDPRAAVFRKRAKIYVAPVMDIDNVAVGAGGKEQKPHDHNRDWSNEPHWPAVAAAIEHIRREDMAGRFDLFIDLHNPAPNAQQPFFFLAPTDLISHKRRANIEHFLSTCKLEMTGPLVFEGKTYESGARYDDAWRRISKNWVTKNTRDHVVAVTLETPWNTPHSTPAGYKTVGRQLAMAVERYFRESPR
ncbi:MAG: zinc carboxypeptidase [Planctomycetes bacterium]|nr:zinc carboxypeptidase [Planctomycetota bacterium]